MNENVLLSIDIHDGMEAIDVIAALQQYQRKIVKELTNYEKRKFLSSYDIAEYDTDVQRIKNIAKIIKQIEDSLGKRRIYPDSIAVPLGFYYR